MVRRTVSSDDDCFSAGSSDPGAAPAGFLEGAGVKVQSFGSGSQATAPLTPSFREPALAARGRRSVNNITPASGPIFGH